MIFTLISSNSYIIVQLVKMTAEELASEELAEWRERETKHQLDIIQKTELELMTMSNKYLVKTHKGEEIIEEAGKEQLLLEVERETSGSAAATLAPVELDALQDTTSRHESHLFDLNCRICSGKVESAQSDTVAVAEEESAEKRKKKKPSSNESTSKDRHHKDSHKKRRKDEKDDKSKDRRHSSSSRSEKSKEKDRSNKTSSRDAKSHHHSKHKTTDREREKEKDKNRKKEKSTKVVVVKPDVVSVKTEEIKEQDFDIISKILQSQELQNVVNTYEINGEPAKSMETVESNVIPVKQPSPALPPSSQLSKPVKLDEDIISKQEQEPTLTVTIRLVIILYI